MDNSGWNMYVFRDGRKIVSGRALLDSVTASLEHLTSYDENHVLSGLIAAGELECALADSDAENADRLGSTQLRNSCELTDAFAEMLVRRELSDVQALLRTASEIRAAGEYPISVHEGFAYYALHPAKFTALIDTLVRDGELRIESQPGFCVIGIRSIGAPLSAVVRASIAAKGTRVERVTVRPTGHPYDRRLEMNADLRQWVQRHRDDTFLIVDEGPGISGSSFLAVADALSECGVDAGRILMLGTRQVGGSDLRANNAAQRWPKYRFYCTESAPVYPAGATIPISGGLWRRVFLKNFDDQPAAWPQLEMAKFLSSDHERFYKFEGFGHFGNARGERAGALHDGGFGVPYFGNEKGFGTYQVEQGMMLSACDVSRPLLRRMAEYCAFRALEFPGDSSQPSALEEMLRWNWKCEFGTELSAGDSTLEIKRLTLADSRMLPHKWLATANSVVKLDAVAHGDDHFFPGPCDIAWDLAGVIVEWSLDLAAEEEFISAYARVSGDDPRSRLRPYVLAYATFRMAWSKMAAHACAGEFDEHLLVRDYHRYRAWLQSVTGAVPLELQTSAEQAA